MQCIDSSAFNYNPSARALDACVPRIVGCTDPVAENYFISANVDSGDCLFAGCTDSVRPNFDGSATVDSGLCAALFSGCTDPTALNYNVLFNVLDNSCRFLGCLDSNDLEYNPTATVDGACSTGKTPLDLPVFACSHVFRFCAHCQPDDLSVCTSL